MLELEIGIIDGFGYLVVAVVSTLINNSLILRCGDIRPVRVINIFKIDNCFAKVLDWLRNARRSQVSNQVF